VTKPDGGKTTLGRMNDDGWEPTKTDFPANTQGRWPANLILSHHEDCECVGSKKVKSGVHGSAPGGFNPTGETLFGKGDATVDVSGGYADKDGNEEVEDWVCHEACPIRILDEQSGVSKSTGGRAGGNLGGNGKYGEFENMERANAGGLGDTGGASRFFYQAKSAKRERNFGMPEGTKNIHPTVKPVALMRWLVRLITPPGGTLLDPFLGSGSTMLAAMLEDVNCLGCEQEAEYYEIAKQRCDYAYEHLEELRDIVDKVKKSKAKKKKAKA